MAIAVPLGGATAGIAGTISPSFPAEHARATFDFNLFDTGCDPLSYDIYADYWDESPTLVSEDVEVALDEGTSDLDGTFVVPSDVAGGEYHFVVTCGPEGETSERGLPFEFSRLLLAKTVDGTAPEGTTFTVSVTCPDDPETTQYELGDVEEAREFPAAGGSAQVVLYEQTQDCTVTETEDGGADSTTVDPSEVAFTDYGDQTSTVTNTFDPDPEPSPSPSPTEDDSDVDDTVDEAEPAEPVEAEPDYTG